MKKALQPASMAKPTNYSLGIEASGRMVFVSGLVPVDADGRTVHAGDIRAQARHVLANIEKVIAEAGGTRDNIVRMTVYIADLSNYAGFVEVRTEFFQAPYPASAAVQAKLLHPDWMLEIEAIAVV